MSSSVLRFECVIPNTNDGTSQNSAVLTFIQNMAGLTTIFRYSAIVTDASLVDSWHQIVYGYLTSAQQPTALAYLNTLNAALGSNVPTAVWSATTEP